MGLDLHMLPGDRLEAVAPIAETLGIRSWRTELKSAEKIACLAEMKAAGRRVLTVGDGLNDARRLPPPMCRCRRSAPERPLPAAIAAEFGAQRSQPEYAVGQAPSRIVVRLKSAAETLLSRTWLRPDCFAA
jgi:Cu2+-exporting ATPase